MKRFSHTLLDTSHNIRMEFHSVETVANYYSREVDSSKRNAEIYKSFTESVYKNGLHHVFSWDRLPGFYEDAFSWNWKLLVDSCPQSFRFLEIGVYKGRVLSQIGWFAERSSKQAYIVGVTPLSVAADKFSSYEECDYAAEIRNGFYRVNSANSQYTLINGISQDENIIDSAKNSGPYDILFVDGCHDYDAVCSDINNYTQMLKPGGYLVIDDSALYLDGAHGNFLGHPDVFNAVRDTLDNNPGFVHLYAVGHNRVWKKIST